MRINFISCEKVYKNKRMTKGNLSLTLLHSNYLICPSKRTKNSTHNCFNEIYIETILLHSLTVFNGTFWLKYTSNNNYHLWSVMQRKCLHICFKNIKRIRTIYNRICILNLSNIYRFSDILRLFTKVTVSTVTDKRTKIINNFKSFL